MELNLIPRPETVSFMGGTSAYVPVSEEIDPNFAQEQYELNVTAEGISPTSGRIAESLRRHGRRVLMRNDGALVAAM